MPWPVRSMVPLKKQKPRPDFVNPKNGPNENRFVSFNHDPKIFSNVRNVNPPDFKRYTERKDLWAVSNDKEPNMCSYFPKQDLI
jgi:hypothetical protein